MMLIGRAEPTAGYSVPFLLLELLARWKIAVIQVQ